MRPNAIPTTELPARISIAHPLDEFYARSGLILPPLERIDAEAVPEPYKRLLVHERDMTSTLEQYHQSRIHLRVAGTQLIGDTYDREVVLVLDGSEKPVEFGAIRIHLERFEPDARELILAARLPLGRILNDTGAAYVSQPKAFLRLASDRTIDGLLNLRGVHILYGRRNTLTNTSGEPLAEIVEILPPATPPI